MISVVAHSVFLSIIYCMMTEKYTTEVSLTNVDKRACSSQYLSKSTKITICN